jgi:DNA-binding LacI/PurR family transcriptional regulator
VVAEELGVSVMTVSNAYNRPDQLSAGLRVQILDTARRLGYPGPDPIARGLRRGRAGALGLIHDTRLSYAVRDPALLAFLGGVGDAAEAARLGLLLVSGNAFEERNPSAISDALVDGLVVYSVADGDPLVAAALRRKVSTVVVDQPRLPGVPFVGIDDRGAAREAAKHVLELGHRRLGVISLPLLPDGRQGLADTDRQRRARYPVHRDRLAGYADAIEAAGLPWSEVPVYESVESTMPCGRQAATVLFDHGEEPPTAILAASDQLALGAIETANQRGLLVPDQLSIVGFDDIPATGAQTSPLTTVRQDHGRKGQLAVGCLLASLRGDPPPDPQLLDYRLVTRASTARAPDRW